MKNDLHIQMMKKANHIIKLVNKKLDELYVKHQQAEAAAASQNKKAA